MRAVKKLCARCRGISECDSVLDEGRIVDLFDNFAHRRNLYQSRAAQIARASDDCFQTVKEFFRVVGEIRRMKPEVKNLALVCRPFQPLHSSLDSPGNRNDGTNA